MYGTRWELGGKYYGFGLNAVTVNDDAGSISLFNSLRPEMHERGAADLQVKIPQVYLVMSRGSGRRLLRQRCPGVTGISSGSAAARPEPILNVVPWSTHGSFEWRDLGGGFGLVPGGFATMANPGLVPDYRGFAGADLSQGILNGQLSLSGNFNSWRDNLNGAKDVQHRHHKDRFLVGLWDCGLHLQVCTYLNATASPRTSRRTTLIRSLNTLRAETNFVSTSPSSISLELQLHHRPHFLPDGEFLPSRWTLASGIWPPCTWPRTWIAIVIPSRSFT